MIAADVMLWGTKIGTVVQEDAHSFCKFSYDKKFKNSRIEISPLMMPLSERIYSFPNLSEESFKGLPGMLADSLPDKFGTKLIERYMSDQGKRADEISSVEKLCYIGNRGMGALEYVPSNIEDIPNQSINIDALVKLASDILSERSSLDSNHDQSLMEQIVKIGTSAGGARAKAIIAWNEKNNDVRSGQVETGKDYGYWIIKFDGVENNKDKEKEADHTEYTTIEYAYYLMAKAAGIDMSECRLFEENGRKHFMTKRFDRNPNSGDSYAIVSRNCSL